MPGFDTFRGGGGFGRVRDGVDFGEVFRDDDRPFLMPRMDLLMPDDTLDAVVGVAGLLVGRLLMGEAFGLLMRLSTDSKKLLLFFATCSSSRTLRSLIGEEFALLMPR